MRARTVIIGSLVAWLVAGAARAADFDGDGTGEAGVFRPDAGAWALRGLTRFYLGSLNDVPVAGDFDGNGTDDLAVFRPSSGLWVVRGLTRLYFGASGDNPVAGDFDGDERSDIGIYRAEWGLWAVRDLTRAFFGYPSDIPVAGPYRVPGQAEFAVFRPGTGLWAVLGVTRAYFGSAADLPVPRDCTGDSIWETAVFRDGIGLWAVPAVTRAYLGKVADVPQPGDYGGEETSRIGIFRPGSGMWAIQGLSRFYLGQMGDIPVGAPRFQSRTRPSLSFFGIQPESTLNSQTSLVKIREAGAAATVKGIRWARIEPEDTTPDRYNWAEYDAELSAPAALGLTPIVIIIDIPSWTSSTRSGPLKVEFLPHFAEFVNALVSRYSRPPYNIKFWELFNEPDGTSPRWGAGIGSWGYHGYEYARMLQAAYPAIKAADPAAQVFFGGLAYDWFTEEGGNFNRLFINDVLGQGGGKYFDALDFHYYYFHHETWDPFGHGILGKINYLSGQVNLYGQVKPMVCTETGTWGYNTPPYLEAQACYLAQVYTRGVAAGLLGLTWFPLSSEIGVTYEGGLMYGDYSPKPAYYAFQAAVRELEGYRYQAPLESGSENIEGYVFLSPATGKTKQVAWSDGSDAAEEMSFSGGQFRVVGKTGESRIVADGGAEDLDGEINGAVRLGIVPSPQYVEIWEE